MVSTQKATALLDFIGSYRTAIVAFSGGVDSSLLALASHKVLGDQARIVTAISPSVSAMQEELACRFARQYGMNHQVIHTEEMEDPNYTSNPSNRCYFCKSELYGYLSRLRRDWGVDVIFDGSNADDVGDYRPGRQAAAESEVVSPFIEVAMGKDEIRQLSRNWQLPTWDLPAMPCLSSRFPYGVNITTEKLRQVEQAEDYLRGLGLKNFRVRHHEEIARIEIAPSEMAALLNLQTFEQINGRLKEIGYRYVTLDLQGFRSGSLNELLQLEK